MRQKGTMRKHWKITSGTGLMVIALLGGILLAACQGKQSAVSRTQQNAIQTQNQITANLVKKQPPYAPPYSDERQNINERTARYADPNRISYITVLTNQGGILYHGVVKGKVSSVDSQVTPADGMDCQHFGGNDPRPDGCGVVRIAEPDGSWGTNNANAVFWFDDKNVYHETTMPYMVSDQEQTLTTPPLLTINAHAQQNALPAPGQ